MKLENFSSCQDVLRRLQKTFYAFFKRWREGCEPGYPRFKSAGWYDSITFPTYGDGCKFVNTCQLRIEGGRFLLSLLNWNFPEDHPVNARIAAPEIGFCQHWRR